MPPACCARVRSASWARPTAQLMWRLHVVAATRLADALLPRMARGRLAGGWCSIGSRVAQGLPGRSQYAASKAALLALARSWAAEVVARGVTVNLVSPAATDTAMLADPARAATPPKLPPIGRLIRADEVAGTRGLPAVRRGRRHHRAGPADLCGGASLPR